MKIRFGFVSNSSSSSFVVAFNGSKPSQEQLLEVLGAKKGSPAESMLRPIAELILKDRKDKITIKQLMEDYCADSEEALLKNSGEVGRIVALLKGGWFVSSVSVDYNNETLAEMLRKIETRDFVTFRWY